MPLPKDFFKNVKKATYNQYEIYAIEDSGNRSMEPSALIDRFLRASPLENKGRGGIKLLQIDNRQIVCRKYIHGGLLRAITRDIFFSGHRAIQELEILLYLEEKGFPVVQPYGVIIETDSAVKHPYILTVFEANSTDLLEVLSRSAQKERYRIIQGLARLMRQLEKSGVYHPDLHLNNILVTAGGEMKFLDFDRACRKAITKDDMERMFWRLNRYVEKMEREGKIKTGINEKALFLRVYGKSAGVDMAGRMAKKRGHKRLLSRMGWFFGSLMYGKGKDVKGMTKA